MLRRINYLKNKRTITAIMNLNSLDPKNKSRFSYEDFISGDDVSENCVLCTAFDHLKKCRSVIKIPKNNIGERRLELDADMTTKILNVCPEVAAAYATVNRNKAIVMQQFDCDLHAIDFRRCLFRFDDVFLKILDMVEQLHSYNIYHHDLKLENVVINRKTDEVRLIDFEFASDTKRSSGRKGTRFRSAPEQYFAGCCCYDISFDSEKADIFALGVLYFNAVTRRNLFFDKKNYKMCRFFLDRQTYNSTLVRNMCHPVPSMRWSINRTRRFLTGLKN